MSVNKLFPFGKNELIAAENDFLIIFRVFIFYVSICQHSLGMADRPTVLGELAHVGGSTLKTFKLCHPSTIRTVLSPDDAKRLQQAGWLQVDDAHAVSKGAQEQRQVRERYRSLGFRLMTVWLPPEAFAAIQRDKPPGVPLAAFITRLLCGDDQ